MSGRWSSAEDALYVKNSKGEFKRVERPIEGAVHYKWLTGSTYEKVDVGSGSSGAGKEDSWKAWRPTQSDDDWGSQISVRKVEVRQRFDEADHERERDRVRREGVDVLDIRYKVQREENDPWQQSSGWSSSGWTSGWRGSRSDPQSTVSLTVGEEWLVWWFHRRLR